MVFACGPRQCFPVLILEPFNIPAHFVCLPVQTNTIQLISSLEETGDVQNVSWTRAGKHLSHIWSFVWFKYKECCLYSVVLSYAIYVQDIFKIVIGAWTVSTLMMNKCYSCHSNILVMFTILSFKAQIIAVWIMGVAHTCVLRRATVLCVRVQMSLTADRALQVSPTTTGITVEHWDDTNK